MDKLLQELYRLRERLYMGDFNFSSPDKIDWNEDEELDLILVGKWIDAAYEQSRITTNNEIEDALNAILADYELEKLNERQTNS